MLREHIHRLHLLVYYMPLSSTRFLFLSESSPFPSILAQLGSGAHENGMAKGEMETFSRQAVYTLSLSQCGDSDPLYVEHTLTNMKLRQQILDVEFDYFNDFVGHPLVVFSLIIFLVILLGDVFSVAWYELL